MIRFATALDVAYYLSERGLPSSDALLSCYVISHGRSSMLATLKSIGGGVAEVHISCPKNSVMQSRSMCWEFLTFIKSLGFIMAKTDAADEYKTAQNMLIKLGFVRYNESEFMRVL
jgi:hypothetical protein